MTHILSKREEILELIATVPELDDGLRKKTAKYVEEVFEIFSDPELRAEEIEARCRGINLMHRHFGEPTS